MEIWENIYGIYIYACECGVYTEMYYSFLSLAHTHIFHLLFWNTVFHSIHIPIVADVDDGSMPQQQKMK